MVELGSITGNPPNIFPKPVAFGFILIAALVEFERTLLTLAGGLLLRKVIILSSSHPLNAPPIVLTLSGIVILLSALQ